MPCEVIVNIEIVSTAYTAKQIPEYAGMQVAIAGRSNVGKSSFLNFLAGRKNWAKIGSKPGKTRSINFYHVAPQNFYLVDLTGYGFANASKEEKRKWQELIQAYFSRVKTLRAIVLLLDCRHPPLESDLDMVAFAKSLNLTIVPILTKSDKCGYEQQRQRMAEWQVMVSSCPVIVSSLKKTGRSEAQAAILAALCDNSNCGGNELLQSTIVCHSGGSIPVSMPCPVDSSTARHKSE